MRSRAVWLALGALGLGLGGMYLGSPFGPGAGISEPSPPPRAESAGGEHRGQLGTAEPVSGPAGSEAPAAAAPDAAQLHPLLGAADQLILTGPAGMAAAPESLQGLTKRLLETDDAAAGCPALTIDYPLDESVFPPEMVAPTFLWHEPAAEADTWLIEIASGDPAARICVLTPGRPPLPGPIDPTCIAPSNQLYQPTAYQASARSWTPDARLWAAIRTTAIERPASVTIRGLRSDDPGQFLSRGRMSLSVSQDPVGAPIFYRDVPLAPAMTEKGVIKPLGEDAVGLIAWRLRDISQPESRLLLTDVPTCTNCHSFSDDGRTVGMDLDGPQGDKGAYVLAPLEQQTRFTDERVISWNSFPDKPKDHNTIGFLSRVSPDGQYVVSTVNESVYVSNFMDYRFLQVFFPTRGILACYSRASGEIQALPGADDPQYVHCDAVWTPDGQQLIFARAAAKDPYPADGRLAAYPNDPLETQIQYDLYRIPFRDGQGGQAEPIAGAAGNGMSNNFPKVAPDGRWIVFVQCRNGQLLRPDSTLWIVPVEGGTARRMRCNTPLMNSWHAFSPNSRWMVFSSKTNTPYTQIFLTHLDEAGNDSPAVLIPNSTASNRAVNLPEFVNIPYDDLLSIQVPAVEYYRRAFRGVQLARQGKFAEALVEFDASLELRPDFEHAHIEAAMALTRQGRFEEALERLNKALQLDPDHSRAQGNAGLLLAQSGRLDEATIRFQKALELEPTYRTAHANLARIFLERGQLEQATSHFRSAMELDPQDPQGHLELADVLVQRKQLAEAVAELKAALALDPRLVDAHLLLAKARVAQGDYQSAIAQLQRASALDPSNIRPAADLAWLLAVCPQDDVRNGAQAVEVATRICAATNFKSPILLNTLAAGYAEMGNFPAAIATADKALALLGAQDQFLAEWIGQNLQRYRAGQPCRPAP